MAKPRATQPVEMLTAEEVARRVRDLGLAPTMSRTRVVQLANEDPQFPVPREEWKLIGRYHQIPWDGRLEAYFRNRRTTPGRPQGSKDKRPRRARTAPAPSSSAEE